MNGTERRISPRTAVGCLLSYAYFVMFPEDLTALTGPLEPLADAAKMLLEISTAISPWLYGIGAAGLTAFTANHITQRILARPARGTQATPPADTNAR